LRVFFDAYWWETGPRANASVQKEIIESWAQNFPDDEIAVALRSGSKFKNSRISAFYTDKKLHALVNYFEVPTLARKWNADVVISHNFASPSKKALSFVFIHDFLFEVKPKWFTMAENIYFRAMLPMSKKADALFTSSLDSAALISQLSRRPVHPTGLSLPTELLNASPKMPLKLLKTSNFLLTVGRLNVRKNLAATISAYLGSEKSGPNFPLVIVGQPSGKSERMSEQIKRGIADESLIFLENLEPGELAWLYLNAESLLFFSLGEGFGIPIVEAIHFGLPVRVSDIKVFRESLGDAAIYADPLSLEALVQAINCRPTPPPPKDKSIQWSSVVETIRNRAIEGLDA